MFLSDKNGRISSPELKSALSSLGVVIAEDESSEIIKFYNSEGEMYYMELLQDILNGEPTLIENPRPEVETDVDRAMRFVSVEDKYLNEPTVVVRFLEAVRNRILNKMTYEGGTAYEHARTAFYIADAKNISGIVEKIALGMRSIMKLRISHEEIR